MYQKIENSSRVAGHSEGFMSGVGWQPQAGTCQALQYAGNRWSIKQRGDGGLRRGVYGAVKLQLLAWLMCKCGIVGGMQAPTHVPGEDPAIARQGPGVRPRQGGACRYIPKASS